MILYILNDLNNLILNKQEETTNKLYCNGNRCRYTPHVPNGPCRFCYGYKNLNNQNNQN